MTHTKKIVATAVDPEQALENLSATIPRSEDMRIRLPNGGRFASCHQIEALGCVGVVAESRAVS